MAFPNTPVLDTFNAGASQALIARTGWSASVLGTAGWSTNATPDRITHASATAGNFWSAPVADMEVYFTMPAWVGSTQAIRVAVRITVAGASPTFYCVSVATAGTTTFSIDKVVAGVVTNIVASVPTTVVAGDSVGLSVVGIRLTSYYKSGAGAWTQISTGTDASITGPGLGFGFLSATGTASTIDNFGGGEVLPYVRPVRMRSQEPLYRGSYSAISHAADEALPGTTYAMVAQSRQVLRFTKPGSSVAMVAAPAAVTPDLWTPGQIPDRQGPAYTAPRSQVASPLTPDFAWAPVVIDSLVAPLRAGRSSLIPVYDPATNTFADWTPPALVRRQVPWYRPPASLVVNAYTPAVSADSWALGAIDSRQGRYAPPVSFVTGPFAPNPIVSTDYVASIVSRTVTRAAVSSQVVPVWPVPIAADSWVPPSASRFSPYYAGSYSAVMGAADEPIPSDSTDWASVVASRASAYYRGSPDFIAAVYAVNQIVTPDAYTPGLIRNLPRAFYDPPQSAPFAAWDDHACTTLIPDGLLGPDSLLFPDMCPVLDFAGFVTMRPLRAIVETRSRTIPVFDQPAVGIAQAIATVTQSRIPGLRQVRSAAAAPGSSIVIPDSFVPGVVQRATPPAPQRPSQAVPLWLPTITPDALVPAAQSRPRPVSRSVGSSVTSDFTAAAPAQGYVAVARSAPTMRALVRQSVTILPDGDFFVVTQAPAGGGGEWVIWEKPNFPANRRDAWPSFVPPYFRKPSRHEKRGY